MAVDAATVDGLFRAAGVDRRLPGLAVQIQAEFQRQSGLATIPERQMRSDIVSRQFSPETLPVERWQGQRAGVVWGAISGPPM